MKRFGTIILLLFAVCALLYFVAAQRTVQLDEEFQIRANQDPERITIPIAGSDEETLYFDITAAKDDAVISLTYYDEVSPYPDANYPGDAAVLFLNLNIRRPTGANVPTINFALRYRYGDSTPKMLTVDRNDLRFGKYEGDQYVLFMPGAENSDPHTRTVTQGIATSTDITSTTTTLGLFSGNLVQDVYDDFDTVYTVAGAGRHQYSYQVSASERDELHLDILTENTNFKFELINHGTKSPVSSSSYPPGVNAAILIISLNIVGRAQVPVYNTILRYHYNKEYTTKISRVERETLQWAIFDESSQTWRLFDSEQERGNNLETNNVIQTGSSLIDFAQNNNVLGLFAKSGFSDIGGGGGGGGGGGDGSGGGVGGDGQDGNGSSAVTGAGALIAIIVMAVLL